MTTMAERIMRVVQYGWKGLLCVGLVAGCKTETPPASLTLPPENTLGNVEASPRVTILAVGGTQQLAPLAVSLTGAPISSFDSVNFVLASLTDSTKVRLTKAGFVTGLAPSTTAVKVNMFVFKGDIASGDQALFQVTAAAVSGATLSIQPVAPDSAKLATGVTKVITPVIRNPTTGASVASPVMRYTVKAADALRVMVFNPSLVVPGTLLRVVASTTPSVSTATPGGILPLVGQGSAWIYASVNAYGTVLQDSVLYTLTYPYTLTIPFAKSNLEIVSSTGTGRIAGQTIALAPGATVTFQNSVAATDPLTMSVTFDNPAAATASSPASTTGGAAGNVTALIGGQTSKRIFLTPGTVHWTATAASGPAPWAGQTLSGALLIK